MKARLSAAVTALGLLAACSLEQLQLGQWYTIGTPATGGCAPLRMRFYIGADRAIHGYLANAGQERIADLSGTIGSDDSFRMTAHAAGATGVIDGRFTSQVSTIAVHGNAAGPACDGTTFSLRLSGYLSSQDGGGGGGQR